MQNQKNLTKVELGHMFYKFINFLFILITFKNFKF